jgi:hypothetical protein
LPTPEDVVAAGVEEVVEDMMRTERR